MKTVKIVLSMLGVTLLTFSFGQLIAQTNRSSDLNIARFMESEDEVLFYTAKYNAENGRTMHWVNHNPGESYPFVSSEGYDAPLFSRTYFAREVRAGYEELPVLESWMSIPFKSSLEESETGVEQWMITPFEIGFAEEELEIEPWMKESWL